MMMKNLALMALIVIACALPAFAEDISFGEKWGPDYLTGSYSYKHAFDPARSLSVSYLNDAASAEFSSVTLMYDIHPTNEAQITFSYMNNLQKDQLSSNGIGIRYKDFFFRSSDLDAWLPTYTLAANYARYDYTNAKLSDNVTDILAGLGLNAGLRFNTSVTADDYMYSNERAIKQLTFTRFFQIGRGPLLQLSAAAPKVIYEWDSNFSLFDFLWLYYDTNTIDDLQGDTLGGVTVGATWYITSWLSLDMNAEDDSGIKYGSFTVDITY